MQKGVLSLDGTPFKVEKERFFGYTNIFLFDPIDKRKDRNIG